MIYAYKINNGVINYLGVSDKQERLLKALEMANISTEGILFTNTEPVMAGGKYYLSTDDDGYIAAKAEEDRRRAEQEAMPTAEERIEAQVMYTALMTDTLLEEV